MKNHHEVGHFKNRLMIGLLSLLAIGVMAGQSYATDCSSCHEMPPLDSTDGSRQPATGAFKGSHQKHIGASASADQCAKCHGSAAATYTNDHAAPNFLIKMNANINSSPAVASYGTKGTSFPQSNVYPPVLESCSNVNCHFEKSGASAPKWGETAPATDCNSCHDTPRGASGTHQTHENLYGGVASCSKCHPDYSTNKFGHASSAGKRKISVNAGLNYSGGTTISWLPSQTKAYGTCSNTYCHSNGNATYQNMTWGGTTSTGCNFCHPNLSAGHTVHVGSLINEISFYNYTSTKSSGSTYKFGCVNCHPFTVASHINNTIDVDLTANVSGGHLKALNGVGASIDGSKKCTNVYCHSNGLKPVYTYAQTPAWGSAFTGDKCAACHGNSPNSTIVGSAAHTAHIVGIHYDDIFNGVSKKLPQAGGTAVNAAHGKNSRSTTINCNICHAVTVTSFANDQNTTCALCHKAGGNPAPLMGDAVIAEKSKHVNGSVDVDFINQKIATKAQLASTAFAGYTAAASGGWSRNKNIYKTYTSGYDVTKASLAAVAVWSQVNGCSNVACHASIVVKWTDTITCTGCHTRLK